jgi:hypothetical protein
MKGKDKKSRKESWQKNENLSCPSEEQGYTSLSSEFAVKKLWLNFISMITRTPTTFAFGWKSSNQR